MFIIPASLTLYGRRPLNNNKEEEEKGGIIKSKRERSRRRGNGSSPYLPYAMQRNATQRCVVVVLMHR